MEAETHHPNVIPIERGREPPFGPPVPLREAILSGIVTWAFEADPTCEYTQGCVQALVSTLRDAGMPFHTWKDELPAETLMDLDALRIDLGRDDNDPLTSVHVLSVGGRDVGAVETRYHGSHTAFRMTPSGPAVLRTFPTFELAMLVVRGADTVADLTAGQ